MLERTICLVNRAVIKNWHHIPRAASEGKAVVVTPRTRCQRLAKSRASPSTAREVNSIAMGLT